MKILWKLVSNNLINRARKIFRRATNRYILECTFCFYRSARNITPYQKCKIPLNNCQIIADKKVSKGWGITVILYDDKKNNNFFNDFVNESKKFLTFFFSSEISFHLSVHLLASSSFKTVVLNFFFSWGSSKNDVMVLGVNYYVTTALKLCNKKCNDGRGRVE